MEGAAAALRRAIAVLDGLIDEEDNARPVRVSRTSSEQPARRLSCMPCRQAKCRCTATEDEGVSCPRCASQGLDCTFPPRVKPGRKKGFSRRSLMFQASRRELVDALGELEGTTNPRLPTIFPPLDSASTSSASPGPAAATATSTASDLAAFTPVSPTGTITPEQEVEDYGVPELDNALAVLSDLSLRQRSDRETDDWISRSEQFYASGLYQTREEDLRDDPVALGIVSSAVLTRLVKLYFEKLWSFMWLLSPSLHTAGFVRDVSPFLTTVICAAAAMFDPLCTPQQAQALREHADTLAMSALHFNRRSIEVAQAFILHAHWAPPGESWSDDRSWSLIGFAARMATEIRLELDVTGSDLARYQQLTPISRDALPLLVADRRQTWNVIFCSDLSISTQTGRLASMSGIQLNGAAGFSVTPNEVDPSDPEYNCIANDAFNRHVSKSLVLFARMREVTASRSEYRNVFNSRWKASVAQWNLDWPHIHVFVRIHHYHIKIMLLALSLRLQGPSKPILQECQEAASEIVRLAAGWDSDDVLYASNFAIINVAYGTALLLKFLRLAPSTSPSQVALVVSQCEKVVQNLLRIATARPNAPSMASIQAARIHLLLLHFRTPSPSTAASPPHPLPQPTNAAARPTVLDFPIPETPLSSVPPLAGIESDPNLWFPLQDSFDSFMTDGAGDWGDGGTSGTGLGEDMAWLGNGWEDTSWLEGFIGGPFVGEETTGQGAPSLEATEGLRGEL